MRVSFDLCMICQELNVKKLESGSSTQKHGCFLALVKIKNLEFYSLLRKILL